MRSWWKDPISEKYFYLHPEFVSKYENKEKGQKCYGFVTCDKCCRCFENGKIPEECVAKADFGDYNRLGLEKLTSKEKLVLALHRPYIHIDKIRFTKRPNDERQYALKSNSISFPHKSGSVVVESLTKSVKNAEAIMSSAVIQFVGSKNEVDMLAAKCYGSSIMKLRPYVILQWLKVLSHVNPFYVKYCDEINSMNVNDLKKGFQLGIEKMKKNALKTVQKEDDSNESVLEDDVQHIRDEQAFSQTKQKRTGY